MSNNLNEFVDRLSGYFFSIMQEVYKRQSDDLLKGKVSVPPPGGFGNERRERGRDHRNGASIEEKKTGSTDRKGRRAAGGHLRHRRRRDRYVQYFDHGRVCGGRLRCSSAMLKKYKELNI